MTNDDISCFLYFSVIPSKKSRCFWLTSLSHISKMASYDASEEACRKIVNDYGMEAIDEALDYYAEKAMNEAAAEYEELIVDAEESVKDSLAHLMEMIAYFEKLRDKLFLLLEINSKIDNTHVC